MGKTFWVCLASGLVVVGGFIMTAMAVLTPGLAPARSDSTTRKRLVYVPGSESHGLASSPQDEKLTFRPQKLMPPLPVIKKIPLGDVAKGDKTLNPKDLILGVAIGEQARAYPINMLSGPRREIINDRLGGRAIAATW